ncbi:MAG TPA: hypothetical protein VG323_04185, partial [Thermoanaerobaculia bacterium]|nr:hypothetical protein [Thermoanaerobaculia bacterium]
MVKRIALIAAAVVTVGLLPIFPAKKGPSDYDLELRRIGANLAAKPATLRRAGFLYQRASLTADFNDFRAAE